MRRLLRWLRPVPVNPFMFPWDRDGRDPGKWRP